MKLPATEEGTCYGTPAIRVKGKFLLRLKEDAETVVIKTPFDYRQALLQADPRVFYFAGMNEEWARWFPAEPPARQGAALLLVREGMRLSVAVIALEGDSAPWRHGA